MSAAIGGIIASAFAELVTTAIAKLTGKHADDVPELAAIVERVVRDAMNAGIHQLEAKLEQEVAAIGLAFEIRALGDTLAGVDEWFRPKGTFPKLGIDVELVDEITEDDRKAERLRWDDLKTPVPDGSSGR